MKVFQRIWLVIPCLILSALIHTIDTEVGGVAGLQSSSIIISVLVWSLPFLLSAAISLAALSILGRQMFLKVMLASSGVLGFLVSVAGSSATSTLGFAWSLLSVSSVIAVFLTTSLLPTLLIHRTSHNELTR